MPKIAFTQSCLGHGNLTMDVRTGPLRGLFAREWFHLCEVRGNSPSWKVVTSYSILEYRFQGNMSSRQRNEAVQDFMQKEIAMVLLSKL